MFLIIREVIDWNAVKNSGIDFVFVRVGYRGYSNGALKEDPNAAANINGALTAGLKVGVYMFSPGSQCR